MVVSGFLPNSLASKSVTLAINMRFLSAVKPSGVSLKLTKGTGLKPVNCAEAQSIAFGIAHIGLHIFEPQRGIIIEAEIRPKAEDKAVFRAIIPLVIFVFWRNIRIAARNAETQKRLKPLTRGAQNALQSHHGGFVIISPHFDAGMGTIGKFNRQNRVKLATGNHGETLAVNFRIIGFIGHQTAANTDIVLGLGRAERHG